jgi:hypothetical protein
MTASDPFLIPQSLRDNIFAMSTAGESIETMCQRMADAQLEKLAAIKLLREATHSTLSEAKRNVHLSAAYRARYASDNVFHQSIFKALDEESLAAEEPAHQLRARAS